MSKYTYKEIKEIIQATPVEFKNWQELDFTNNGYGCGLEIGYFHPSDANWSYRVIAFINKKTIESIHTRPILVVQVFGVTKTN